MRAQTTYAALRVRGVAIGFFLLLPAAGACSSGSDLEETVVDIQGAWTLDAVLEQDQGPMTCQITGLNMAIEMQGNTQLFGGQTSSGVLSCTGGDEPFQSGLPLMVIGNGIQVSFNLSQGGDGFDPGETFLELDGDLSGTRMEGQVQGFIFLGDLGETLAFSGTFVNVRVSS